MSDLDFTPNLIRLAQGIAIISVLHLVIVCVIACVGGRK